MVLTYLIKDQADSIVYTPAKNNTDNTTRQQGGEDIVAFIAGDDSYTPKFLTQDMLDNCAAACNNDPSCCFDGSVGGQAFVDAFVDEQENVVAASKAGELAADFNFPPQLSGPTAVTAPSTPGALATYAATDSDGVNEADLTCTICDQSELVSCAKSMTG